MRYELFVIFTKLRQLTILLLNATNAQPINRSQYVHKINFSVIHLDIKWIKSQKHLQWKPESASEF